MWDRRDNQEVGLEAAILERVRNSSLVKWFRADNVAGLKHTAEAVALQHVPVVASARWRPGAGVGRGASCGGRSGGGIQPGTARGGESRDEEREGRENLPPRETKGSWGKRIRHIGRA